MSELIEVFFEGPSAGLEELFCRLMPHEVESGVWMGQQFYRRTANREDSSVTVMVVEGSETAWCLPDVDALVVWVSGAVDERTEDTERRALAVLRRRPAVLYAITATADDLLFALDCLPVE